MRWLLSFSCHCGRDCRDQITQDILFLHHLSVTSDTDCSELLGRITNSRVPSGSIKIEGSLCRGLCRYQLRRENSPVVRMQGRAKSISGDLDIFQLNGPYFKRLLHSLRQWHSYCAVNLLIYWFCRVTHFLAPCLV